MQSKITLATAATALLAPALAQAVPDGSSQGVTFISRITKQASAGSFNVEGYRVSTVHVGAGRAALTLIPASAGSPGIFFSNGTIQESFAHNDSILQSYSTNQYPSGIVIADASTGETKRAATVNLGSSTKGVSIFGVTESEDPGSQPFLGYRPLGAQIGSTATQFIVCNETVYGADDVPLLFWEDPANGGVTPSECAEVKLLPKCEGDIANATAFTQESYCYKDAASAQVFN